MNFVVLGVTLKCIVGTAVVLYSKVGGGRSFGILASMTGSLLTCCTP